MKSVKLWVIIFSLVAATYPPPAAPDDTFDGTYACALATEALASVDIFVVCRYVETSVGYIYTVRLRLTESNRNVTLGAIVSAILAANEYVTTTTAAGFGIAMDNETLVFDMVSAHMCRDRYSDDPAVFVLCLLNVVQRPE